MVNSVHVTTFMETRAFPIKEKIRLLHITVIISSFVFFHDSYNCKIPKFDQNCCLCASHHPRERHAYTNCHIFLFWNVTNITFILQQTVMEVHRYWPIKSTTSSFFSACHLALLHFKFLCFTVSLFIFILYLSSCSLNFIVVKYDVAFTSKCQPKCLVLQIAESSVSSCGPDLGSNKPRTVKEPSLLLLSSSCCKCSSDVVTFQATRGKWLQHLGTVTGDTRLARVVTTVLSYRPPSLHKCAFTSHFLWNACARPPGSPLFWFYSSSSASHSCISNLMQNTLC